MGTLCFVTVFCFVACSVVITQVVSQHVVYDYVEEKEDSSENYDVTDFDALFSNIGLSSTYENQGHSTSRRPQNALILRNPAHELTRYKSPRYRTGYRGYREPRRSGYYRRSGNRRYYSQPPLDGGREGGDHYSRGYYQQQVRVKKVPIFKKVYLPVPFIPKKKKKKIISVDKGFHVEGGAEIFGKFKKLEQCMKLCAAIPTCLAADYNPWLYKCYIHSAATACETLQAHKKFVHFKKVPCEVPETENGLVTLGMQLFNGLEQKGIKNLQDCIKKCANAGGGIAPDIEALNDDFPQLCFGIDYDFATHKCYFHTDRDLCPENEDDPVERPEDLEPNPAVINILLCPPR